MRTHSSIELLEARVAPALVLTGGSTATYTDVDGDLVTIKLSKPLIAQVIFALTVRGSLGGEQLTSIDLSATSLQGVSFTLTAKPQDVTGDGIPDGDGLANVGYLNASGRDLGAVLIKGDLAKMNAGSGSTTVPAVTRLTVQSIGEYLGDTGAADVTSTFNGGLPLLAVKGSVRGEIHCTQKIGAVTIGGSLEGLALRSSGSISGDGGIGSVTIAGSILGGQDKLTGRISSAGAIGNVSVGGSLLGVDIPETGEIEAALGLGKVKIGGNVVGRGYSDTGKISSGGNIAGVAIGGSLLGGSANTSGFIGSAGKLGPVKIGGDVVGGGGSKTGFITGELGVSSVTIGGSLIGGSSESGMISSTGTLGPITIRGDIRGGNADTVAVKDTGTIFGGRIISLTVGGSIISGKEISGGELTRSGSVHALFDLGAITVKGSLIGNATFPVIISASGAFSTTNIAVKSLTVGGNVEFTNIQAGFNENSRGTNADAQMGPIKVRGDWKASYVIAGVNPGGDGRVGTADDIKLAGDFGGGPVKDAPGVISRIASITIGGQVIGQPETPNTFGFVAEQIGTFKYNGIIVRLTPGASNDTFPLNARPVGPTLSGLTPDLFAVHVVEV